MQLGEGGARLGQEGTLQGVWHHGAGQEVGVCMGAVSSGVLTSNNFPPIACLGLKKKVYGAVF